MVISVRLSAHENELLKDFARLHNVSVSGFIRKALLEHMENEIDLAAYDKAMAEYKANPVTFTLDEVEKEIDDGL